MDVKNTLSELINFENKPNQSFREIREIEKLILVMLKDYIINQGKEFTTEYRPPNKKIRYDGYAPDGFDDYVGKTVIEIKIFRFGGHSFNIVYDMIGRISMLDDVDNVILILIGAGKFELPKDVINRLNFKLSIWDINKITEISNKNPDLFNQTYAQLNTLIIKDTITEGIKDTNSDEKRETLIELLHNEYDNDNIVLFLGAGVSMDAGIASWDKLISSLFVELIKKELNGKGISISSSEQARIVDEMINQNGTSPLLQARFLRRGFEKEFEENISNILYENVKGTSKLLDEIGQLCVPNRGKIGIQAIVNYNFDDLIEKTLNKLRVPFHSIYSEGINASNSEVGIHHVHGFLPQSKEQYKDLGKSLLVFSEEGYHKLMLEPYNWANITQLNYMINNTCLFIGLSMTDPNMRRLLEIAAQKRDDINEECKHYAIMKRFKIASNKSSETLSKFESVNDLLQESFFKELGVNILWVDDYKEIPDILKKIKGLNFA